MTTIVLGGALGKRYGERHTFEVNTAREAFFACNQFPGFMNMFSMSSYAVRYGSKDSSYLIDERGIDLRSQNNSVISFIPVIEGDDDIVKIAIGVAIFIAAPYIGVALGTTGAILGGSVGVAIAGFATNVGIALVLGGIAGIISPTPNSPGAGGGGGDQTTDPDYLTTGPINTANQGGAVPLVFGRAVVGSVVVSSGIVSESLNPGALPVLTTRPSPPSTPSPTRKFDPINDPCHLWTWQGIQRPSRCRK